MAHTPIDVGQLLQTLKLEFRDSASDILATLNDHLQAVARDRGGSAELIEALRRNSHNLRGFAGTVGYALLGQIAFRLEDYLGELDSLDSRQQSDVQHFLDRMSDVLDGNLDGASEAQVLRTLPAASQFDPLEVTKLDMQVVLVMPRDLAANIMRREIEACGYATVVVASPFDAIELITRSEPDLVLVSAVLDGLNGTDLACALRVMPATRHIPLVLTTSLADENRLLHDLPRDVPVVHKGKRFSDDFADALERQQVI